MKTQKSINNYKAEALTEVEVNAMLLEIGRVLKAKRNKLTTIDRFAYETGISRSQISKYEAGGDLLLSSFLRHIHGLGISGEAFFRALKI